MTNGQLLRRMFQNREVTEQGCWVWLGALNTAGYGRIGKQYVHRIAAAFFIGPLGDNHVCHKCDNPRCFNPEHLFLGSVADNMRDMVVKGRSAKGDRHSQVRLSDADVLAIVAQWNAGATMDECAKRFGVRHSAIQKIVNRGTWKHLTNGLEIRPAFNRGYRR